MGIELWKKIKILDRVKVGHIKINRLMGIKNIIKIIKRRERKKHERKNKK